MATSDQLTYRIDPEVATTGIQIAMAVLEIPEIKRKRGAELQRFIEEAVQDVRSRIAELRAAPSLAECRRLYREVGISDAQPPAAVLLGLIEQRGDIPNINNVVDAYNIGSARSTVSFGAHTLSQIAGSSIRFVHTNGSELFVPLGKTAPEPVGAGEIACMDDEKILCRMDIKQCDQTKLSRTAEPTNVLLYVQGNRSTSREQVDAALRETCQDLERFCRAKLIRFVEQAA